MTKLTKAISRETAKAYAGRNVIITLAPAGGSQSEALIGLRLKGKRTIRSKQISITDPSWPTAIKQEIK